MYEGICAGSFRGSLLRASMEMVGTSFDVAVDDRFYPMASFDQLCQSPDVLLSPGLVDNTQLKQAQSCMQPALYFDLAAAAASPTCINPNYSVICESQAAIRNHAIPNSTTTSHPLPLKRFVLNPGSPSEQPMVDTEEQAEAFFRRLHPRCECCGSSDRVWYRYLNNKLKLRETHKIQPRYHCHACKRDFTLNGKERIRRVNNPASATATSTVTVHENHIIVAKELAPPRADRRENKRRRGRDLSINESLQHISSPEMHIAKKEYLPGVLYLNAGENFDVAAHAGLDRDGEANSLDRAAVEQLIREPGALTWPHDPLFLSEADLFSVDVESDAAKLCSVPCNAEDTSVFWESTVPLVPEGDAENVVGLAEPPPQLLQEPGALTDRPHDDPLLSETDLQVAVAADIERDAAVLWSVLCDDDTSAFRESAPLIPEGDAENAVGLAEPPLDERVPGRA